jgi:type III restriction enzyme
VRPASPGDRGPRAIHQGEIEIDGGSNHEGTAIDSCSAAELRRKDKTVFFGPDCERTLVDERVEFFREIQDPDGPFSGAAVPVANTYDFKTPLNLAIADAGNEARFIRRMIEPQNAKAIGGWLKNPSQKFYAVEYAWKKGEHPKRGEFSPDFFLKKGDKIFVVEIKGDEEIAEPSPENQKKYEYALSHFQRLNEWLAKEGLSIRYQFNFLSPKDYNKFFEKLRNDDLDGFRSGLDLEMAKAANGKI